MHNLGERLSMDETSLSQGKRGSLVAMIKGTKSDEIAWVLNKMPRSMRMKVRENTIDLSPTMKLIAKQAFPYATIVSDRFHTQKLINKAISDLRVDYRWQAIDIENQYIKIEVIMDAVYNTIESREYHHEDNLSFYRNPDLQ